MTVSIFNSGGQFFVESFDEFRGKKLEEIPEEKRASRNWTICGWSRVARFLPVHNTKTGQNVPKKHKMYQMVINYPKCP
jgi:hypothetical protein